MHVLLAWLFAPMQMFYRHSCRFTILLCIAALGPYVLSAMGLRLEHFVIYGSLLYVICTMSLGKGFQVDRSVFSLLVLSLAMVFWIFVASLRNISWATPYGICAGLENFTQPVALIIVISSAMEGLDRGARLHLLRVAGISTIFMLCTNSCLAILTMFYDTWPFTQYFVIASDAGLGTVSVMELASAGGRLSGVFNQPAEAGLAYSIGAIVWVYLATTCKRINSIAWISLILLIIGGLLSTSKTFILGGFPLSISYWFGTVLRCLRIRKSTLIGGIGWGVAGAVGFSFAAESWRGLGLFLRFFSSDSYENGIIYLFTGTRFGGNESGVGSLFSRTWNESPILGFGVANAQGLDNGYIESFFYGGMIGLVCHIALLGVILLAGIRALRTDPELSWLLICLWVLIIGASIGAPVLTLNRSSIFLWIILVTTFGALSRRRTSELVSSNLQFGQRDLPIH